MRLRDGKCGKAAGGLPFWETLDRSVMILMVFLLLEGAVVAKGMAGG